MTHREPACSPPASTPPLYEDLWLTDQHYRQLEQQYYQSAQYAAMVKRYPLLQNHIAACRSRMWISDASAGAVPPG
jgi:hypothetical protein